MSSASRIAAFLASQDAAELTLTISEVESVAETTLPASARKHAAYWSAGNPLGKALLDAGWRARPMLTDQRVMFSRRALTSSATESGPVSPGPPDLLLIGCVKTKWPGRHRARDLYSSTLFRGRLARCVDSGAPWFILSAKYGLVHPDDEIDAYDETLLDMSGARRQEWSKRVLSQLAERLGDIRGKLVEIHAGYEYRHSGLVPGLTLGGAEVSVPLEGLSIGEQLRWYAHAAAPSPEPLSRAANAPLDADRTSRLIRTITQEFHQGRLDLSQRADAPAPGWDALPEFVAAHELRLHGADDEEVRRFITFLAAMDRARDADALWNRGAALRTQAPWALEPHEVSRRPLHQLRDVLAHFGVSQRHSVDAAAWRLIAEALVAEASPEAIKKAVHDGVGDAAVLLDAIRQATAAGQPWFPLISGPKVSVMWIRMLAAPGNATIQNLDVLPVAVDVQVRKVTEYLGVTSTAGRDLEHVRTEIQAAWADCTDAVGPDVLTGTAAALDPAIWFLGKWGCTFCERARSRQPVSSVCASCTFGSE